MSMARFQPQLDLATRALAEGLVGAVLHACDPAVAFKKHDDPAAHTRPTHILAFGKASIPMTHAAIDSLGTRLARATVLAPPSLCAQASFKSKFVGLHPADHPLPTGRNIDATRALAEHARSIPADHDAMVLISGGGSAMLCSPKPRVTLEEIIETTDRLLRSGAPIGEINTQRAQLETLKGGGLARVLAHVHQTHAYVLSDVIGDDLRTIASGPLIDALPPKIRHTIIAGNDTAIDAAIAWCVRQRIDCVGVRRRATGYASDDGRALARSLIESATPAAPALIAASTAVCLGGEPTVDTGKTTGIGGPALELTVAGALELAATNLNWSIITLTTDGVDGPTDAAGAIITRDMLRDPELITAAQTALSEHNTLPICDTLGATIRTGPTGTNVNDIALAIRWAD